MLRARHVVTAISLGALGCAPDSTVAPVRTSGAPLIASAARSSFVDVKAGQYNGCGLLPGGEAFCWGLNQFGEVGDGTIEQRNKPVSLFGDARFAQIASGFYFNCGLTPGGLALCWGDNRFGDLGDGTQTPHSTPTPVATDLRFKSISAGGYTACALTHAGDAYCWGNNDVGELGDGSRSVRNGLVAVASDLRFTDVSVGESHACGIAREGSVYCWGNNGNGQVGDGSVSADGANPRLSPTRVIGDLHFVAVSAGGYHTCGLTGDGSIYCWGFDGHGELGDGPGLDRVSTPTLAQSSARYVEVSAGQFHTCARTDEGDVYCWGRNDGGALGDGTSTNRGVPTLVIGGLQFAQVSSGQAFTCGRAADRVTFCWGTSVFGQLGNGDVQSMAVPTPVGEVSR
jgi:alpha-tubulin suppressor-like RCC1 family protein